jgi:hypothetical protein
MLEKNGRHPRETFVHPLPPNRNLVFDRRHKTSLYMSDRDQITSLWYIFENTHEARTYRTRGKYSRTVGGRSDARQDAEKTRLSEVLRASFTPAQDSGVSLQLYVSIISYPIWKMIYFQYIIVLFLLCIQIDFPGWIKYIERLLQYTCVRQFISISNR